MSIEQYIHVGYPKCASSFLQMEVFLKEKNIKFHGIIRDPDDTSYFKKIKFNALISEFTHYVRGKCDIAPNSKELFKLMDHDINVISDEDFITSDNISVEGKALRIKSIFPSAKIIIIVRSPTSLLSSFYSHYFRGGHIKVGLNEWMDKELLNYNKSMVLQTTHYKKCIGSFVKNFGRDNVYVLNLEDLRCNKDNFLFSLYRIMGLKYTKKEKKVKKRNESLPLSAIKFGTKYPSIWRARAYVPQFIRRLIRYFFAMVRVKKEYFSHSNVEYINRLYINDVQYLKDEFDIVFQDI